MKNVCIIGHSKGLGKFVSEKMNESYNVLGLSRHNGYDITRNTDKIINLAKKSHILFVNAYSPMYQTDIIKSCINYVDKIIVSGSLAGYFEKIIPGEYAKEKKMLRKYCNLKSLDTNCTTDILHLNLSCIEGNNVNLDNPNAIKCDYEITFDEIYEVIKFWIANPCFSEITFNFKITDLFVSQVKDKIGTQQEIEHLMEKINSI